MQINIPQPCNQDFGNESTNDNLLYCSQCGTHVVDFSTMSDDALIAFIRKNPLVKCGRFNAEQLNREIQIKPIQKYSPKWYYSRIAALLALLFSNKPSVAQQHTVLTEQHIAPSNNSSLYNIQGRIIDETKKPLVGIKIFLNKTLATTTDSNGMYTLNLPKNAPPQNTITLEYTTTIFHTFSYHTATGNQIYNYEFDTRPRLFTYKHIFAGIPANPFYKLSYHNLYFSKNKSSIHNALASDLNDIAQSMKSLPQMPINIYLGNTKNKKLNRERQKQILDYFTNNGIDIERINIYTEDRNTNIDTIRLE